MNKKLIRTIIVGCLIIVYSTDLGHAGLSEQMASANAALAGGRPIEALESYKAILASPALSASSSAELWFNRGLAEEKNGNAPAAALSFRRALLLDPGFAPARRQLSVLLGGLGIPFEFGWRETLTTMIPPEFLILGGSVMGWIGIFGLIILLMAGPRKKGFVLLAIILAIAGHGVCVLGTLIDSRFLAAKQAVITAKEAQELKATPADNAASMGSVVPGALIRIVSRNGVWWYVSEGSGPHASQGWIHSDTATPLLP